MAIPMFWENTPSWLAPFVTPLITSVITSIGTLALLMLKTPLETYLQRRTRRREFDLDVAIELAALVSKVAEEAGDYWHENDGPELRRTEQKIVGGLHQIKASLELCRDFSSHFAGADFDRDVKRLRAVIQRGGFETHGRLPDHRRASEIIKVGESLKSKIRKAHRQTL